MMKRVHILTGVSLAVLAALLCDPQPVHAQDDSNDFSIARRADVLLHRMDDDSGPSCDDDIPGAWRIEYFGTTNINSTTCAVCDPDGDGYSNLQEYNLSTDPTNSASHPTSIPAGLVVWWKLDEGTNTTVTDYSGNEHNGSLQGDPLPVWTNGVVSGALNFDGSQNFVGSDCAISQTFTAATMECWFTADNVYGENPAILSTVHDDNPDYAGYLGSLGIYNSDVRPDLGNLLSFFMIVDMAAVLTNAFEGNYHHLAGVWDGSQIYLYYDGTLVASTNAAGGPVDADCNVRLAYQDTNGGCFLGGNVGEIRIYNRALTSNEVVASYNTDTIGDGIPDWWRFKYFGSGTTTNSSSCTTCDPDGDGYSNLQEYNLGTNPTNSASHPDLPPGLVLWWKLDEGSGTIVADSSGNEHSGTLQGDPLPTWTNGVVSGGLNFDGDQNFVGSDYPISQTFTAATMECWFTADSLSGENPAIFSTVHDDNPDSDAGYLGTLGIYNSDVRPDLGNDLSFFLKVNTASANINTFDGKYHHVVGVWDGSCIQLYYDSTLVASTNTSSGPIHANCYVRLAYQDTNGGCLLGGNVSGARLYNRALSSNEVTASFNADTIGDGIPDRWRLQHFGSGTTTDSTSCASCDADGDGLSNLQEYQQGTDPHNNDSDNDFWFDGAEASLGTSPTNSVSAPEFSFTINGGTDVVSTTALHIDLPSGMVADSIVISENMIFSNCVTNTFSWAFDHTLTNDVDGLHTLFLKLLKTDGTTSPIFGETVEVDRNPPSISIMSPTNGVTVAQRRINVEGFAADASTTNATVSDASRPLLVTVNGDFVNDRDTNGLWWSAQDLMPGTNTFTAIATDRAGFAVTNSVWFIYDPTLATNVPVFTVDVTNTVTVGSNATSFAISGTIDDNNASIQINVLDAVGNTITNATAGAATIGTNWWAEVPVTAGSNIVVISAANTASLPATNSFMMIQSTNTFLGIDSPVADTDVNATNVLVVGHASANFDASITINGVPADTSLDVNGITFSNSVPINSVDANIIEVDATGTDGSSATTHQTVYGYQLLNWRESLILEENHIDSDCWYAQHFPHDHEYQAYDYTLIQANALPASDSHYVYRNAYSLAGDFLEWDSVSPRTEYYDYWDPGTYGIDMSWFGSMRQETRTSGTHLSDGSHGSLSGDNAYDFSICHAAGDCTCASYCVAEATSDCCVPEAHEHFLWMGQNEDTITFIKHWPTNEEQTVLLHFNEMYYEEGPALGFGSDPAKITFWGQRGVFHSLSPWGYTNIAFLVKIKTNHRYTVRGGDFTYPTVSRTTIDFTTQGVTQIKDENLYTDHTLFYDGIGNDLIQLNSTKGANSPVSFDFGKTDLTDPCSDSKAKALVVYYKDVVNQDFEVQPFDVKLQIIPGGNTDGASWTKHSGPNSGTLNNDGSTTATFSNPAKGGTYQFDLSYVGTTSRAQLLLPLAGADIATWLDSEIKAIPAWAQEQKVAVLAANDSVIPGLRRIRVLKTWMLISRELFDYDLEPVDSSNRGACKEYNKKLQNVEIPIYDFVTVNGTVVHGSKIANMLWGVFGRAWGYSTDELKFGAEYNELKNWGLNPATWQLDPVSSQNSVAIGGGLYDLLQGNPNVDIKSALTQQQVLRMRQDNDALLEQNLWPGDEADLSKSHLARPTNLPTTPGN